MRKLTLTLVTLTLIAAPLFGDSRCQPEWTAFNCAIWRLGVDEDQIARAANMQHTHYIRLTDEHSALFWKARSMNDTHDFEVREVYPRLADYSHEIGQLEVLGAISHDQAQTLYRDLDRVENSLESQPWFRK